MQLVEFDYPLPEAQIAQQPLAERDASRMLVINRDQGTFEHAEFRQIARFLSPGDLVVFNESKVIHARLLGQRKTGGRVEIFLLKALKANVFECLVRASASQKNGLEFTIGNELAGRVLEQLPNSISFAVEFDVHDPTELYAALESVGHVPLPPYIDREDQVSDRSRYQTVYAREPGSVAAPTAGLHYTPRILAELQEKGIETHFVNLHVGLGTFQPIKAENILEHRMHEESFFVPPSVTEAVLAAKAKGKRILAVGTTSARSLESAARGFRETTNLYLYPGQKFKWVNSMQTNFHQPKSSLLVMMAAFMGKDLLFRAYQEALQKQYRFLSYGDSMLVL